LPQAEWTDNNTAHVLLGETIPVFPGETILTNFTLDPADGAWVIEIGVAPGAPGALPPARRGPTVSRVRATSPYMDPSLAWSDPRFNTTRVGACMEVYGMLRRADYPLRTAMNLTLSVPGPLAAGRDLGSWAFTENPTCAFTPQASAVESAVQPPGTDGAVVQQAGFVIM
jgi:hypothetical protein